MTSARTPLPLPPSSSLTCAIIAPSFSYGVSRPSGAPFRCATSASAPRSRTSKARVEPERRDAAPRRVVQELDVVKRAAAAVEAREDLRPARLLLVAVRELDVRVREGLL